ncbi:MAG: DUF4162 domain-containing protein, partial [Nitrospirae bacterium]|nr:DUF4162 domain-containing protein [Nitrospirota bacterium]
VTIFISTAYLDEAERCTRVGLMYRGRLLIKDEPMAVKKSLGMPMIELWSDDARTAKGIVKEIEGVKGVNIYGDRLHVTIEEREKVESIIAQLRHWGIEIKDYREILPSIEDVFISMVEGK